MVDMFSVRNMQKYVYLEMDERELMSYYYLTKYDKTAVSAGELTSMRSLWLGN